MKRGQISFEYLILMGFVTLVISTILGISLLYTGGVQDQVRTTQIEKFGNKIISTAESVFYAGEPSKSTITVYLPEGVEIIEIIENTLIVNFQSTGGTNVRGFTSRVNINGTITNSPGLKNIELVAGVDSVLISQV